MQLQGPLRLASSGYQRGLGGITTRVGAAGVCDKIFFLQLAASVIAPRQAILASFRPRWLLSLFASPLHRP